LISYIFKKHDISCEKDFEPRRSHFSTVSIFQLTRQVRRQVIQGYGEIQLHSLNDLDADLHASHTAFMQMTAAVAPAREKMQVESRKIQGAER